jgi:tRNA pseudouridine38-40 synthase
VSRTLALTLEYDGTGLCGWQRQDNGPTVQAHLEEALAAMTGASVIVHGASRTDAGVHARGQVAHFATTAHIPNDGFRCGLNATLPPAIAVLGCRDVAPDFHARFSARGKHYRYAVLNRPDRSPLLRHRAWHRPRPLDVAAMRAAAAHLCGELDFAAFRAAGCSARTTRRHIRSIAVTERDGGLLEIDVHGNAFLRNMVRIIAGTLVEVGRQRMRADDLPGVIASRARETAGPTAPAHGLTLMEVIYDSM